MKRWSLFVCIVVVWAGAVAQRPLRWYTNSDSTSYVGFRFSGQTWMRFTNQNPGTLINGEPNDHFFDVSVRRVRLQAFGMIDKKTAFNVSLGQNNINYVTASSGEIRLLDLYMERSIRPWLSIGTGQSAWNGLSRYSAPHTSRMMTLDIPILAIPTVNLSDNILRKLGAYVHGQWQSLDYRVVFSRPYANLVQTPTTSSASFAGGNPGVQTAAYLKYFLMGMESKTGLHPFTYLQGKKLLILGAGMEYQPHAMWKLEGTDTVTHPLRLIAVDVFGEFPTVKKQAVTFYMGYFHYDFGPNFIRMIGVNNVASGVNASGTFNGAGNRFPAVGTGQSLYGQLGYFIPLAQKPGQGFQFFTSWQYSNYERLADPMVYHESGVNYFLREQTSKLTFGIQSWPFYNANVIGDQVMGGRRSSFVLQYQVRLE